MEGYRVELFLESVNALYADALRGSVDRLADAMFARFDRDVAKRMNRGWKRVDQIGAQIAWLERDVAMPVDNQKMRLGRAEARRYYGTSRSEEQLQITFRKRRIHTRELKVSALMQYLLSKS